jgi:DNA-binding MarR family transcriptional regulator
MTTPKKTDAAIVLTDIVLSVFRLNGTLLAAAEMIAAPAGLTAARWQVLGAVMPAPRPVAAIAREMGLTRQSVQRQADVLVAEELAEYLDNPAHQRSKLLSPTPAGRAAIQRLLGRQHMWVNAISDGISERALTECRRMLRTLIERAEDDELLPRALRGQTRR